MIEPWKIPRSWHWATMGEIAKIVGGGTPKTGEPRNFSGNISWITPADLSGYREKYISKGARNISERGLSNSGAKILPKGTVLFSSRAPIGYVAIAKNEVTTSQGFKSFVLNGDLLPEYVYYYLQFGKKFAVELSSGTTFPEISGKAAAQIPIPVPPKLEQSKIVEEIESGLSRLDAGIAAITAAKIKLKRYRAAVLMAACGGMLVETEANIAGREKRSYETGEDLVKKLRSKDPRVHLEEEDNSNLPSGWHWASLDEIRQEGRPIIYGIIKPGPHIPGGVKYVRVTEMKNGIIDVEKLKRTSFERAKKFARATLAAGDILISKDGTIGRVAVVPPELAGGNITQHVMRVPIDERICRDYVVIAIRSNGCQRWLTGETRGVALKGVNVEDFRRLPIPLPPLAEQKRIAEEVGRLLSEVDRQGNLLDSIMRKGDQTRRALLRRAFSENFSGYGFLGQNEFEVVESEEGCPGPGFVTYIEERIAAGDFDRPQLGSQGTKWIKLNTRRRLTKDMFVADIVGDSMEPRVPEGSKVLFGPCSVPKQDGCYVFRIQTLGDDEAGGRYNLKRCVIKRGKVHLIPENPEHPVRIYGSDSGLSCVAKLLEVL